MFSVQKGKVNYVPDWAVKEHKTLEKDKEHSTQPEGHAHDAPPDEIAFESRVRVPRKTKGYQGMLLLKEHIRESDMRRLCVRAGGHFAQFVDPKFVAQSQAAMVSPAAMEQLDTFRSKLFSAAPTPASSAPPSATIGNQSAWTSTVASSSARLDPPLLPPPPDAKQPSAAPSHLKHRALVPKLVFVDPAARAAHSTRVVVPGHHKLSSREDVCGIPATERATLAVGLLLRSPGETRLKLEARQLPLHLLGSAGRFYPVLQLKWTCDDIEYCKQGLNLKLFDELSHRQENRFDTYRRKTFALDLEETCRLPTTEMALAYQRTRAEADRLNTTIDLLETLEWYSKLVEQVLGSHALPLPTKDDVIHDRSISPAECRVMSELHQMVEQVAVIDASTVRSLLRIFLEPQWQYHFSSPPVAAIFYFLREHFNIHDLDFKMWCDEIGLPSSFTARKLDKQHRRVTQLSATQLVVAKWRERQAMVNEMGGIFADEYAAESKLKQQADKEKEKDASSRGKRRATMRRSISSASGKRRGSVNLLELERERLQLKSAPAGGQQQASGWATLRSES